MRIDNPTFSPGSLNTVATASLSTSASALVGSQATYLTTTKNNVTQSISNSYVQLTNWDTAVASINASEWNATTGTFTATKTGTYFVNTQLQMGSTAQSLGLAIGIQIRKNGFNVTTGLSVYQVTATGSQLPIIPVPATTAAVIQVTPGDTIGIFGFSGVTAFTHPFGTQLTIQEIPTRLQR